MDKKRFNWIGIVLPFLLVLAFSCKGSKKPPAVTDIAATPEELRIKITEDIREMVEFASANAGNAGDSTFLHHDSLVRAVYEQNQFQPVWSQEKLYSPLADSMLAFLEKANLYGLFPIDYHYPFLDSVRQLILKDTLSKKERSDAALWSKSDILLTDAFFHVISDLKLGRLPKDSVTLRKDSILSAAFYLERFNVARKNRSLALAFQSLEPVHEGYRQLKSAIPAFLSTADYREKVVVPSPKDSSFKRLLQTRLYQGGYLDQDTVAADSLVLVNAIKKFQGQQNIAVDGKVGDGTVRVLNITDKDRFVRIAITMDRYKLLPEQMPDRYIWVNIPSYSMKLRQGDSVKIESKIICGKPITRTPVLTSAISELITYPQWTIPTSIIVKEILPALKRNPDYLAKKGFSLINGKGEEVDPYTVDWTKYSKGIPYKVVQGSGDDNALGILKFNFLNKYAVYLHDTNQRYLFSQSTRSLSHGCVRVQEWDKLAYSIIRYDHKEKLDGRPSAVEDSLRTWLDRKEKHSIPVRNRLPVYIRYFTCEAQNQGIAFYDDIYGEDKLLQRKYFAGK